MSGECGNEIYRWKNGGIHLYILPYNHDFFNDLESCKEIILAKVV